MTSVCLPGGAGWAPMCAHGEWGALYDGMLARCARCGLVVTAAAPDFDYARNYFTGGAGGGYDFDGDFAKDHDAARFAEELDWLERQGLRGTLLDIGCATGTYLVMARARGWDVSGVELADFARETAARRTGARVVASIAALGRESVADVVTLHHVLEHVHEPVAFLRDEVGPRVRRRLLIEVPNFASLLARAEGRRWRDLRPEQHVCHYEPDSLRRVVTAAGFDVVRVYTRWQPLWSLRAARELVSALPALTRSPGRGPADAKTLGTDGRAHEAARVPYQRPAGLRLSLVRATRLAMRPLVRTLEKGQLAERLVIEAAPPGMAR